jgi:hypothetical protein
MAKVIVQYVREASEDVIAHHREAIEEHGMRVLGDPEVELVLEEDYIHIHDAPEIYRLTFEVESASGAGRRPCHIDRLAAAEDDGLLLVARTRGLPV